MRGFNRKEFLNSLDLSTECTECGYKIHPAELLYVDEQKVRCPKCGKDFLPKGSDKPLMQCQYNPPKPR